jgi:quercetin dioxygenase-like cupin family protein
MMRIWVGLVTTILVVVAGESHFDAAQKNQERARVAFAHALPQMHGDKLSVTLVEVDYGPGESSAAHSHPCPVIGYVVEGAYRTQVKGEAEVIYKAGETFYEPPNGVHAISANASDKEPVKFLAYFVCDHEHKALSVEVPASKAEGEK